jgi:hypothetical protein
MFLCFLEYLIVAIFVVPINAQGDCNSLVSPDAPISLSMDNWIFGGMGAAAGIFVLIMTCTKSKT